MEVRLANDRSFQVHGSLLEGAKFFQNLPTEERESKKSRETSFRLETVLPAVFEMYVQWLYTRKFATQSLVDKKLYGAYVDAYVLGDKIDDDEYRDAAMDKIIARWEGTGRIPSRTVFRAAFQNTLKGSPLRLIMVDIYVHGRNTEGAMKQDYANKYPADFVNEYINTLLLLSEETRGKSLPWETNREMYYAHHDSKSNHNTKGKEKVLVESHWIDDVRTIPDQDNDSEASQ